MSLIWSDHLKEPESPALLLIRHAEMKANAKNSALSDKERLEAYDEIENYANKIRNAQMDACSAAKLAAEAGENRTHALVIGVGQYDDQSIPEVSTAIHGAVKFTEWLLTEFDNPACPLGSVSLLLSPDATTGDWVPSDVAAARLGIPPGTAICVGAATHSNICEAFRHWIGRAASMHENIAFFYFAGHGLWKVDQYLVPQDAQIAGMTTYFDKLIDIQMTVTRLHASEPSIQCFFVDACQEFTQALHENVDGQVGSPIILHAETLCGSNNSKVVKRDAWIFVGSNPGECAYGPSSGAPYFTQELLNCLRRRGAESIRDNSLWSVTTTSLAKALDAAGRMRAEQEGVAISFSSTCKLSGAIGQNIYRFPGPPEVLLRIYCDPRSMTEKGHLFVNSGEQRNHRNMPKSEDWYTTVQYGEFSAGAYFSLSPEPVIGPEMIAMPPLFPVAVKVDGR